MTDFHTKATGSGSNIQTNSYINDENTDNTIAPPSTENSLKDHRSLHISTSTSFVNKKKIFILGDSMVKHIEGWDISSKLHNNHKVYVRSFSSSKVKFIKDYSKPCIKEDKPDHITLHVETNDLACESNAERTAKSIVKLAKRLVADDCTVSVCSIVPRNYKSKGKAAELNSYLQKMCSNVNMHFIDNVGVINPKMHLNNSKLHLSLKDSAKLSGVFINSIKKMYSIRSPHTQSRPSRNKYLTLIRNKLTGDKTNCPLEKGKNSENFKYYLSSLRRKDLNRVILAQLNINFIRNKFDLLPEGIT